MAKRSRFGVGFLHISNIVGVEALRSRYTNRLLTPFVCPNENISKTHNTMITIGNFKEVLLSLGFTQDGAQNVYSKEYHLNGNLVGDTRMSVNFAEKRTKIISLVRRGR